MFCNYYDIITAQLDFIQNYDSRKCGLRPTKPIVARFRPLYKTRSKKTRPHNLFFVVYDYDFV